MWERIFSFCFNDFRYTRIGARQLTAFGVGASACKVVFGAEQFMFGPGDHFAEEVLFVKPRQKFYLTRTVLTLSYTQLLSFTRRDFIKLKETCPMLAACHERELGSTVNGKARQPGESWVRYTVEEEGTSADEPQAKAGKKWAMASPKNKPLSAPGVSKELAEKALNSADQSTKTTMAASIAGGKKNMKS